MIRVPETYAFVHALDCQRSCRRRCCPLSLFLLKLQCKLVIGILFLARNSGSFLRRPLQKGGPCKKAALAKRRPLQKEERGEEQRAAPFALSRAPSYAFCIVTLFRSWQSRGTAMHAVEDRRNVVRSKGAFLRLYGLRPALKAPRSRAPNGAEGNQHRAGRRSRICLKTAEIRT